MRQTIFLTTSFIIYFLTFTATAQTVQIKGIVREEIIVKEGKITVYLPDDMRTGDNISGTVISEPSGDTEKEKARNNTSLQKYKLSAGSVIAQVSSQRQPLKLLVPENKLSFSLSDERGITVKQFDIPFQTKPVSAANNTSLPTHALTNSPVRITGVFDGDLSTTKCRLDGKPMEILAESPRQTVCTMPQTTSGPHTITIEEKGITTEKNISAVNMDLAAGKLNLTKGENTYVDVAITGLQNLPSNATLSVTNTTTSVVAMNGGNTQVLPIPPSGVSGTGTFNKRFDLQSIRTGTFSVNVNLDLPEPPASSSAITSNWVACNLGVTTCILPGTICDKLQKKMKEKMNQQPLPQSLPVVISPANSSAFTNTFTNDHAVVTLSQADKQEPVNEVIFTYEKITTDYKIKKQRKENKEWLLDNDSLPLDGFSVKAPLYRFDPGLYSFHATAYYGSNQTYTHTNYVVVPQKRNAPTVTNAEIERLKKEEQRLRDSINAINRRIESGSGKINDNYKQRRTLDSLRHIHSTLYNQLYRIDALIEQIPDEYGIPLQNLLDSLERFRQKAGSLSATQLQEAVDKMQQEVDDLEAADLFAG